MLHMPEITVALLHIHNRRINLHAKIAQCEPDDLPLYVEKRWLCLLNPVGGSVCSTGRSDTAVTQLGYSTSEREDCGSQRQ